MATPLRGSFPSHEDSRNVTRIHASQSPNCEVTMLLFQLVVAVALAVVSSAAPAPSTHALHEKRDAPASDWVKGARIEGDAILPMRIGLTQTNLEKGYDFLMEV